MFSGKLYEVVVLKLKDPHAKAAPLRNEKGVKIRWFPLFSVCIEVTCITEL